MGSPSPGWPAGLHLVPCPRVRPALCERLSSPAGRSSASPWRPVRSHPRDPRPRAASHGLAPCVASSRRRSQVLQSRGTYRREGRCSGFDGRRRGLRVRRRGRCLGAGAERRRRSRARVGRGRLARTRVLRLPTGCRPSRRRTSAGCGAVPGSDEIAPSPAEALRWKTTWRDGPGLRLSTAAGDFMVFPHPDGWRCVPPGGQPGVMFRDQEAAMAYAENSCRSRPPL
jgi:hypothetical protein